MILSKNDYIKFLNADQQALGRKASRPKFFGDEIWKFQRYLRELEYRTNCKQTFFGAVRRVIVKYYFHQLSIKCGFSIPCNVFGPGLSIAHRGTIVVHRNSKVGSFCRIHACVNIGASGGSTAAPKIGDNVYIGPGAKLYGDIELADRIAVGANAVVNSSFLEPGISIAGVPARKINERGSYFMDETRLAKAV